jgi:glutamine amidotransferase
MSIVIVNYGIGNLAAIKNMLRKLGHDSVITSDITEIDKGGKLIIPGVGAFGKGMENIKAMNLLDVLNKKALVDKVPALGICLGMQLLTSHSEEGNVDGLNWIPAQVQKFVFNPEQKLTVPHMGWTDIEPNPNHWLFKGYTEQPRFYFAHSYYVGYNDKYTIATAQYGFKLACAIEYENITGVQFHPEKSHRFGLTLLNNFATK